MVQMFLPKIHRMRRRIRRQMARQQQMLADAAVFFENPDENYGAPGESPAGAPPVRVKQEEELDDEEAGGLPECPAHLITCPAPAIDPNAKLSPPTSHFQHLPHSSDLSNAGHQGTHQQGQREEPGPMPGVRPPMGGAGGIVPPPQTKGSGAMGIIMPLYTVGIVVFFVYTIMKVLFKKGQDDDKTPKLKDFGLDPEYRKYVFAEEYLDNTDISTKDQMRRQAREESRNRKKNQTTEVPPDTKIAEGLLMDQGRMDTQGKKLGNWYLPEGFLNEDDVESDEEYFLNNIGGTTVEESAQESLQDRLFSRQKKDKKKRRQFVYEDINSEEDLQNIINMRKTERENEQRQQQSAATKRDLETDDEDGTITDLDFLYSDVFLNLLRKGLRNYDPDGNLDGETLENMCIVAREHLRKKYIDNKDDVDDDDDEEEEEGEEEEEEEEQFQQQPPDDDHPEPETVESSCLEGEAASEEIIHYPEDARLDQYDTPTTRRKMASFQGDCFSIIRGEAELSSNLEGSDEDRSSFKEFESEDDLEFSSEPEKDIDRNKADNVRSERIRDVVLNDSAEEMEGKSECEKKDEQLDQLRRRLEETEKAMERLMCQMGSVTDKLTAAKITEVLSQAQAQAKILKEEVGEMTSEEDLTSSEALTTTLSEDTSLPASLQRHLEEIQVEQSNFSDILKEVGQLQLGQLQFEATPPLGVSLNGTLPQAEVTDAVDNTDVQGQEVSALGDFIPAGRTVIQLQALKDDGVPIEEPEAAPTEEPLPAALETEEAIHEEKPNIEEVQIPELPEKREDAYPEKEKEFQTEAPSDVHETTPPAVSVPEKVCEEPRRPSGTCETEEKNGLNDEPDAEEAVALPVPVSKEDTSKPTAEPPVVLAREMSSEGSSEATETGADISDLRSFAEENANKENAENNIPAQQSIVPPLVMELSVEKDEESVSVCKGQGTQTSFAFSVVPTPQIDSKEDSTQTEKEQEVAVLGMNTSFRHDEGGVETKGGSHGPVPSHQVTEILLDALLPSETQLLVKDAQVVGSSHAQDIEIEASEAGAVPCVVTSNVSLAFLGLEHRDDITPSPSNNSTLIADDAPDNVQQQVKDTPVAAEVAPDNVHKEVKDTPVVDENQEVKDTPVVDENQEVKDTPVLDENQEVKDTPVIDETQEATETPATGADVLDNAEQGLEDTVIVNENVPDNTQQEIKDTPKQESQVLETEKQELIPESTVCEGPASTVPEGSDEKLLQKAQETGSVVISEVTVKTEISDTNEKLLPEIESKKATDQIPQSELLPDNSDLVARNEVSDTEKPEKEILKSSLIPERTIGEQPAEVLPRPSSPLPPHRPEDEEELEEEEKEPDVAPQIPITPSLEAIAEAVAAATTRAALDVIATSKPESFLTPEEIQSITTRSTFLTEEIPMDQSPTSTDESSSATTVVAVSDVDDAVVSKTQPQNSTETAPSETSSQSSVVYVATISHSPSGSPSSTPEMELSGEAVEAALAEAALEEISNNSGVKPNTQEKPAAQEGPGATTVSPVRNSLTLVWPTLTH